MTTKLLLLFLMVCAAPAWGQSKICQKHLSKIAKKQLACMEKHPAWTETECKNVSDRKPFVGMTREMIDAEKPHSCIFDKHPAHKEAGLVSFGCFTQWDHSTADRTLPYMIHFQMTDGRVSAFFYN